MERLNYIILRKPIKHYYFKFLSSSELRITVPLTARDERIEEVIRIKSEWIEQNQQRLAREEANKEVIPEIVPLLGKEYKVILSGEMADQVMINHDTLEIFSEVSFDTLNEREVIYKSMANRIIIPRAWHFAERYDFSIRKIALRGQRRLWGSYNRKGNISLNWKLIIAPMFVIDYLILHELMHSRYHNHGAQYKGELGKLCPRMGEAENWLKENNHLLTMFD